MSESPIIHWIMAEVIVHAKGNHGISCTACIGDHLLGYLFILLKLCLVTGAGIFVITSTCPIAYRYTVPE